MNVFLHCMMVLAVPFVVFLAPVDVVTIRLLGAEVGPILGLTREDLD